MTKQQLREAIRSIIRQELKEAMPASAKRAFEKDIVTDPDYIELKKKIKDRFFNSRESGDYTGEVPNVAKRDYYVKDKFIDVEDFEDEELAENKPATAPSKPKTEPTVAPGKPAEKKPRRPLGNPNIPEKEPGKRGTPAKAKVTMTEAEMLAKIIKRFKSKK